MRELLAKIEARQPPREKKPTACVSSLCLGNQFAAVEDRLERLDVTRWTILEIVEDSDSGGPEPLPSAYRILARSRTITVCGQGRLPSPGLRHREPSRR
ncbi:hypothetical protein [Streptomyces albogriseolus]|uniref:hypothetical protein n=1 Tax=Streptomyces albogriseolus TaxID=1887 RepID=UPI00345FB3FE